MTKSGLKGVILVLGILMAYGCEAPRSFYKPIDAPLAHSSLAQFDGDPQRLENDIERTFGQLHWGKLHIRRQDTLLRGQALLDDGRTATVMAGPTPDGRLRAKVRVGRFGDRQLEQRFIRTLVKTLAGEPGRSVPTNRGGGHK